MRAYLVRVGIDQAFGGWNAPIDPDSGAFVYVPIPEKAGTPFQPGMAESYEPFRHALAAFPAPKPCTLPANLNGLYPHLDPDFDRLTYGDNGLRRGKGLCDLSRDDLVVFFAGLKPVRPCEHRLVYAIIGLYRVAEAVRLRDIPAERWSENAHTRKLKQGPDDVIIRAIPGRSGRLERAIPIGEFRAKAYRVRQDLLEVWGGLSCRDGFIQRSAVPPTINNVEQFAAWFEAQTPRFIAKNNPMAMVPRPTAIASAATPPSFAQPARPNPARPKATAPTAGPAPVILVHLRQPNRSDANGEYDRSFRKSESALLSGDDRCRLADGQYRYTSIGEAAAGSASLKIPYYALGRHGLHRLLLPSERTQRPALTFAIDNLCNVVWNGALKGAGLVGEDAVLFDDCRQSGAGEANDAISRLRAGGATPATRWPHMLALASLVADSHCIAPSNRTGMERNAFSYGNISPLVTRIRRLADDEMFCAVVDVNGGRSQACGGALDWQRESVRPRAASSAVPAVPRPWR